MRVLKSADTAQVEVFFLPPVRAVICSCADIISCSLVHGCRPCGTLKQARWVKGGWQTWGNGQKIPQLPFDGLLRKRKMRESLNSFFYHKLRCRCSSRLFHVPSISGPISSPRESFFASLNVEEQWLTLRQLPAGALAAEIGLTGEIQAVTLYFMLEDAGIEDGHSSP
jgi:hypothetical protein